MKISEAYQFYETDKKIEGFSKYTFKAYNIQLNLMIRYFGNIDIETITYSQLKQYLAKDADRLKPSSLGHRVRFIKSFFKYLHQEGLISVNPSFKLKEPKEGKRIPKFIPEEEMERIREATNCPREKALISLLYSTGTRIGEIYLMNRNHINWKNKSIIVLGKGSKEREVYFDTKTYIWLKEYLNTREDDCDALFISQRNPIRRATIHSLRRWTKDVAKRANIELNIYPHRFRHTFCTHLLERGAPIEVISSLAGHQKIDTTRIYAHLSGQRRKEIYQKYF